MESDFDKFVRSSVLKHEELLVAIFKDIVVNHPDETKRQHAIRAIVKQFETKYPEEAQRSDVLIRRARETRANQHAANYQYDLRLEFKIPLHIGNVFSRLQKLDINGLGEESFMSDEAQQKYGEKDWFRKHFPRYVIPDIN